MATAKIDVEKVAAAIEVDAGVSLPGLQQALTESNRFIGSDFDDFLAQEGILDECTAVAVKRVIAWQLTQRMKAQKMTKTELATRMHTSRASLNRLLDDTDTSLTLTTLISAAQALGQKVKIEFEQAEEAA